jgi:hypothetical protein
MFAIRARPPVEAMRVPSRSLFTIIVRKSTTFFGGEIRIKTWGCVT